MNRVLTLYADVPRIDGAFLLEVAIGLCAYRLRPEALTLELIGPDKVKLGILIAPHHQDHLPALRERLQALHNVTGIEIDTVPEPGAPPSHR